MKKNFFQIIMGSIAIALGLSSCKKDKEVHNNCVKCFSFTSDNLDTYTFCIGDNNVETEARFNAYVAYIKDVGWDIRYSERCEK